MDLVDLVELVGAREEWEERDNLEKDAADPLNSPTVVTSHSET
eukprot:SAG22_NODE_21313_length_258_cov_0.647799_1_plen_42_part_01